MSDTTGTLREAEREKRRIRRSLTLWGEATRALAGHLERQEPDETAKGFAIATQAIHEAIDAINAALTEGSALRTIAEGGERFDDTNRRYAAEFLRRIKGFRDSVSRLVETDVAEGLTEAAGIRYTSEMTRADWKAAERS